MLMYFKPCVSPRHVFFTFFRAALIDIEDLDSDNMEWQIEEGNRLKNLVRKRILQLQVNPFLKKN